MRSSIPGRILLLTLSLALFLAAQGCGSSGTDSKDTRGQDLRGDSSDLTADNQTPNDLIEDLLPPPLDLVPDHGSADGDLTPWDTDTVDPCAGGCDDLDPCTMDTCDPTAGCVHDLIPDCCGGQFPLAIDFESEDPLAGSEIINLVPEYPDAPEEKFLSWQVVDDFAFKGTHSIYFGDPEARTYNNGHRVAARLELPEVTLAADTEHELRFWYYLDVEEGPYSDYFVIMVKVDGRDIPIWAKDTGNVTMKQWMQLKLDLTEFAGQTVSLVYVFDSHDEKQNSGKGIFLDDIMVEAACETYSCAGNNDCYTSSPCISGQCVEGSCEFTMDQECCLTPAECEDWDGCTIDTCSGNVCGRQNDPSPTCCNTNDQCHDQDDLCTIDVCRNNSCAYLPSGEQGCCTMDSHCDDGDECTLDMCSQQSCYHINRCCVQDADCDDGDEVCTADKCLNGVCFYMPTGAEGCCDSTVLDEGFESGSLSGWLLDSDLPGGAWAIAAGDAEDGENALAISVENSSGSGTATATLPLSGIPPVGGTMKFSLKLTMDDSGDCGTNEFRVMLGQQELYANCNTLYSWLTVELDLSTHGGETADLRFEFEMDPWTSATASVLVDNLEITQECCTSNADCDDSNPCTNDFCPGTNSICQFDPIADCCLNNGECADEDECTQDICTLDHECTHSNLCCDSTAECDDQDDVCTTDACIDNFCVYTPTGAEGCCIPNIFQDGFETGNLSAYTIALDTEDPAVGWKVTTAKSHTGAKSLYFGNDAGNDYGDYNDGSITSAPVEIPMGNQITFSFWTWYHTESCCDRLKVYVIAGENTIEVDSIAGESNTWVQKTYDATPFAGQTVQLKLEFHSDVSTSYEGVFIDDIELLYACCNEDADCNDGDACTLDSCPGLSSVCINQPVEGCCTTSSQCDDQDDCTEDHCSASDGQGGECSHTNICCTADEECDDGDDLCTNDLCIDSFCQHFPTGSEGCCEPDVFSNDFESGDLSAWQIVLDVQDQSMAWRLSTTKFHSGASSLYFGNPAGSSYGNNSDGTITSGEVEIPEGTPVSFSLWTWYHTEASYDWVKVSVAVGGELFEVDRIAGESNGWEQRSWDASDFAGQTVRLVLTFHSDTSTTYEGVFIDDIQLLAECCSQDSDCDDGNPCTLDSCPGINSMCVFMPVQDCCASNAQCNDGNACTQDICSASGGQGGECSHVEICCNGNSDCNDGDPICTNDLCVDGACQFQPTGASGCCDPLVLFADFEGAGPVLEFQATEESEGSWHYAEGMAAEGSGSLAFSNAQNTDYGDSNDASVTTDSIPLPNQPGLTLTFDVWYESEACCDKWTLHLLTGDEDIVLESTGGESDGWETRTYSLEEYAGRSVKLEFSFHSDGSVSKRGVFIDNLAINQQCCSEDSECDDGNICTQDSCPGTASNCLFQKIPECCLGQDDCDDNDPCTQDSCNMGNNTCVHHYACCSGDGDCDDDDPCTNDSCEDSFCVFTPGTSGECCEPQLVVYGFESGPEGFQLSSNSPDFGWWVTNLIAAVGNKCLAFTNEDGTDYGSNSFGTALSPLIGLPVSSSLKLKFSLSTHIESCCDQLKVSIISGGEETELDTFTGNTAGQWNDVVLPLSQFGGKQVKIKFTFESDYAISYKGAFIDNLRITQDCP